MNSKRFDAAKLEKLNNPERLRLISPEYIWSRLNVKSARVLVDIGAGTGFFSIPFLGFCPGGRLYACDASETMLKWIRERVCPFHPDIIPVLTQGTSIPLESGIADLVYMINVHHEQDEPIALLKESLRLLRPGGKIFISDWRKGAVDGGPPEEERVSPQEVAHQLIEAGFVNISVDSGLVKNFLVFAEKPLS